VNLLRHLGPALNGEASSLVQNAVPRIAGTGRRGERRISDTVGTYRRAGQGSGQEARIPHGRDGSIDVRPPVSDSSTHASGTATTVSLHASRRATIDLEQAALAMTTLDWLGSEVVGSDDRHDLRRVSTDLELSTRDGSATGPIRKSALIDIGLPTALPDGILVEIGWQSASLAPLFPVFAGQLVIKRGGLVLDGRYAPPLGRLGLLIDAGVLHLAAERTAEAFLAQLAGRMLA
jgi:hypothetical protein